jgi:hypothetical protein
VTGPPKRSALAVNFVVSSALTTSTQLIPRAGRPSRANPSTVRLYISGSLWKPTGVRTTTLESVFFAVMKPP